MEAAYLLDLFFSPCQVEAQNFSFFPAVSKSFCDRNPVAATLPAMKHSQDALQLNTAVQQTRWSDTRARSQFLRLIPMTLFTIRNKEIKPNIFLHQTGCSNFHLRDNNAYMPKCGIIENLGLTVKAGVLKLVFIENFTLYDSFSEIFFYFISGGFRVFFRCLFIFSVPSQTQERKNKMQEKASSPKKKVVNMLQ